MSPDIHLSVAPAVSSKLSPVKLLPVQPVKVNPFLTAITSALFLNLITGRHCICMTEEAAHKLAKRPDKKNIASFLGLRDIGGLHFLKLYVSLLKEHMFSADDPLQSPTYTCSQRTSSSASSVCR